MKNKLIILTTIALSFLLVLKEVLPVSGKRKLQDNRISLQVIPAKDTFSLGEIVSLKFRFSNNTNSPVAVQDCLNPEDGNLQILISRNDKTYYRYSHSGWGVADGVRAYAPLNPGDSVETTANILWNFVPNVADKSYLLKTNLGTDYVFQVDGEYSIKARCNVHSTEQVFALESAPVKIQITHPVGEDLEVWNRIKNNGKIAYFIQEGDLRIPDYKPEKRAKIQQEIEQLSVQYPNSRLGGQLKQSIEKFNKTEAKRQEYLEKIKQQKQPQ